MTQGEPKRRGRRHNGLDAQRYVPLMDVEPQLGEHLLDVLRLAGVPAYLEPAMDVEPYTLAVQVPTLQLAVPFANISFMEDMHIYGVRELPVTW